MKAYQFTALILYPLTVLFLSTTLAGHIPPSYFSNSRNVLNVYFVKLGWLWSTIAFGSLVIFQPLKRLVPSMGRYVCMTLYWIIMTQWLLGPSLVDRMFVATGGSCHYLPNNDENGMSGLNTSPLTAVLQQTTCRSTGGSWHGGHDVSGHCVLLIHASLFLLEESMQQPDKRKKIIAWAFLGLWYWMLAMTSIYFHGYRELLSGAFFGILGWVILYLGLFPNCQPLAPCYN
ncbi:Fat storage-inducing transmembrane protein [Phascolomyces articulosus]|uniref:Fat storage-inducing transmembrane protein n=1 Tax=Phascolomyces articulosus TaxID=60185 RepID=A0AAD5JZ63_9FUNG|nr:Fat storage-inducing transmembrane protein [Phascolomyces articulosus]